MIRTLTQTRRLILTTTQTWMQMLMQTKTWTRKESTRTNEKSAAAYIPGRTSHFLPLTSQSSFTVIRVLWRRVMTQMRRASLKMSRVNIRPPSLDHRSLVTEGVVPIRGVLILSLTFSTFLAWCYSIIVFFESIYPCLTLITTPLRYSEQIGVNLWVYIPQLASCC
ncbi:hypothetical protein DFP72DRAFT_1173938, partial [Ephemerocybe angulata]